MVSPDSTITIGALEVCPDTTSARFRGAELELSFSQRRILIVLAQGADRVWSREDLYRTAFDRELPRRSRVVDQHVSRIRRALGEDREAVRSIARVGYRLDSHALHVLPDGNASQTYQ